MQQAWDFTFSFNFKISLQWHFPMIHWASSPGDSSNYHWLILSSFTHPHVIPNLHDFLLWNTFGGKYIYIFKHLYLCVFQRKSYRFGMTWVWFIFGWTIPLITGWINVLLSFKCFIGIRTLDISSVHMRVITQKQHLKSKTKSPDILLYPIRRNCSVYYCRKSGNQWWEIRAASGCTVQ